MPWVLGTVSLHVREMIVNSGTLRIIVLNEAMQEFTLGTNSHRVKYIPVLQEILLTEVFKEGPGKEAVSW